MKRIILSVLMLAWMLNGQGTGVLWKSPVVLGRVSAVDVNDQGIFISDRKQFSIFHLDKTGALIKQFGARGEGPGEFRHVAQFTRPERGGVRGALQQEWADQPGLFPE